MKRKQSFFIALICLLSVNLFSAASSFNVNDFAVKLAEELNIEEDLKDDTYEALIEVFPEDINQIFKNHKPSESVTRELLIEVFYYFLDEAEIDNISMAGDPQDLMTEADIDNLLAKSSREGDILTYITPPSHSFTNRLDTKINELYQVEGETGGDTGYPVN